MAQFNITLSQEELLSFLTGNFDEKIKLIHTSLLNAVLMAESTEQLKADSYERTAERADYRNGTRTRNLTTKIGTIELAVPRHRDVPFKTMLFENYQRSDAALVNTMAEMVVAGVSTRKVGRIMEELCGKNFSKSTVSEVSKKLDVEVNEFKNRRLDFCDYPFVMVDATYFKVHEDHRVVSKAMMIAIGFNPEGKKEVIAFDVYDNECNQTWFDFFESLKNKGLRAPLMITSDAHPAIKRAIARTYPGTAWQRCQTHFKRNIIEDVPKKYQTAFSNQLRDMFNCTTIKEARAMKNAIAEEYEDVAERAVNTLEEGFEDSMTVMHFAQDTMRKVLRTSNSVERLNRELKRRSDVIGIFPNKASLLRLMGSVLIDEHEKLLSKNASLTATSINAIHETVKLELHKVAISQANSVAA